MLTRTARALGLGLLVATIAGVFSSAFAPLVTGGRADYLFFSPALGPLLAWWGASTAIVLLVDLGVRRAAPHLRSFPLSPLWLLGLVLVPVLAIPTSIAGLAPPWMYLFLDCRWLFLGTVLALTVHHVLQSVAPAWWSRQVARVRALDRSPAEAHKLAMDIVVAATLAVFSMVASPAARFTSAVIGDEPKYIRYLENWYQGRGMDITDLPAVRNLPPGDAPHLLGNLRHLRDGTVQVVRDLRTDALWLLGRAARTPTPPRVEEGGWFINGKRGGVYQVHNPGSSLLLFPGYVLDRWLLNWRGPDKAQFAGDLYMTSTMLLLIYALWGVGLFRLLLDVSGRVLMSAALAALAMMALPSSAFAYQYYPEAAGGLFVTLLVRFALVSSERRVPWMVVYGLLAGYMPWLHVRFLMMTVLLAAAVVWTRRRSATAAASFITACAIPLLAHGLYYYAISGNPMPWALYSLTEDVAPFTLERLRHLPVFWLDRSWGLVAHAPVYLLAAAGVLVAWRRNRFVAAGIAATVMALAVPAAAHELTGASTTPLRLIASVVPLLMVYVMSLLLAAPGRWTIATAVLLAALSLQNAWIFNVNMVRFSPFLQGPVDSGWLTPLLMPNFDTLLVLRDPEMLAWCLFTILLVALPIVAPRWRHAQLADWCDRQSPAAIAVVLLASFALLASAIGALTGRSYDPRVMTDKVSAIRRLASFHLGQPRGGVRWSSRHAGQIDVGRVLSNPEGTVLSVSPEVAYVEPNEPAILTVVAKAPDGVPGWGRATVFFSDEPGGSRVAVVGSVPVAHAFQNAGEYPVRVGGELAGTPPLAASGRIVVGRFDAPAVAACAGSGPSSFPEALHLQRPTREIRTVTMTPGLLRIRLAPRPADAGPPATLWAWVITPAGTDAIAASGGDSLVVDVPMRRAIAAGTPLCVGLAEKQADDWSTSVRTPVVQIEWPDEALIVPAGIEVTPDEAARWRGGARGESR